MRYQYLDILRWLCIVLMVLFHLNYSLVNIFEINFLNFSEIFWYVIWRASALWFMVISWVSFYLASKKYSYAQLQNKYLKYSWVLAVIAWAISLGTYLFIPQQLILFGILHLFAISFFLLPFITRAKYWAFAALIMLIAVSIFVDSEVESWYLFPLWFYNSDFKSADYYPLIPYFWYIVGWYLWARVLDRYKILSLLATTREISLIEKILSYAWKKSLLLYIIHQPIIVISIWIMKKIV